MRRLVAVAVLVFGCGGKSFHEPDGDADSDTDSESASGSDSDTGSDADTDADSDSNTDTGTGSSTDDECPGEEIVCLGECFDPRTDPSHCGGCGRRCGTDTSCVAGECLCGDVVCRPGESCLDGACVCPDGWVDCGDLCADLSSDLWHCGGCDEVCPRDGICDTGRCICPGTEINCGEYCADTSSEIHDCGACGRDCHAGDCVSGDCVCGILDECEDLWGGGGTICTDVDVDPFHCGSCDGFCNWDQWCEGGECACRPGQTECDGAYYPSCVNTDSDPENCGACENDCPDATPLCWGGVCVAACPAGVEECEAGPYYGRSYCADTSTDPDNCGGCGNDYYYYGRSCQSNQVCVAGRCRDWIPALGCDECPCEPVCGDDVCCGYPGDGLAICVDGATCPE